MRDAAIFFGGLALGVLLAAACGFDLFPSSRSAGPATERPAEVGTSREPPELEGQLAAARVERERLVWELEKLREEIRVRDKEAGAAAAAAENQAGLEEKRPGVGTPAPEGEGDGVLALRRALESSSWAEAAEIADRLLSRGEAGCPLLVEAVGKAVKEGAISREEKLPYPLVRLAARREREVAGLISHALASPSMGDPAFSALLFRLAPEFLKAVPENYPEVRADLVQRLLAALEEGPGKNTWWVLQGLFSLGVDAGVESLSRILFDPGKQELEGAVILHLGRMHRPEAAQALAGFVERAGEARPSAAAVALRELARQGIPEADAALRRFLETDRRDLREAAYPAYFSRPREQADSPLAARFLNSDSSAQAKRKLASLLKEHSPAILFVLRSGTELKTADARAIVAREEVKGPAIPATPNALPRKDR